MSVTLSLCEIQVYWAAYAAKNYLNVKTQIDQTKSIQTNLQNQFYQSKCGGTKPTEN